MPDDKTTPPPAESIPPIPASEPAQAPASGPAPASVLKTDIPSDITKEEKPEENNKTIPPEFPVPPDNLPVKAEGEELPHQSPDLMPEEIIEPAVEPPEPDKEKSEVVVADEDKMPLDKVYTKGAEAPEPKPESKETEVKVNDENKVPLPNVYNKGMETPIPASEPVPYPESKYEPESEPLISEMPRSPATVPKPERRHSEPAEDFNVRFREKLKDQLRRANEKRRQQIDLNLKKIMNFALEHNAITNDDVEEITGLKDTQALIYLNKLLKQGKLVRFGRTKNTFYKPIIK